MAVEKWKINLNIQELIFDDEKTDIRETTKKEDIDQINKINILKIKDNMLLLPIS